MDGCNLSIDKDFIQMQDMLSSMDQRQREKFTEETCGLPHSIFSIVNLYPFLNELRNNPALIGKMCYSFMWNMNIFFILPEFL